VSDRHRAATPSSMTITSRSVVIDCPDPLALAGFYADLLDGQVEVTDAD
jgi:hypothetical protein